MTQPLGLHEDVGPFGTEWDWVSFKPGPSLVSEPSHGWACGHPLTCHQRTWEQRELLTKPCPPLLSETSREQNREKANTKQQVGKG